ncbi:MAG: hypothetical protein RL418_733, partial [Actinomycetota bacterium]
MVFPWQEGICIQVAQGNLGSLSGFPPAKQALFCLIEADFTLIQA